LTAGELPGPLHVAALRAVSPSHFTSLQACALKEVWSGSGNRSLLPASPAAYLGSVVHKLLEEAGQGKFVATGASAISDRWRELLALTEARLKQNWLERHLIPLHASVPQFEVRRLQACKAAEVLNQRRKEHEQSGVSAQPGYGFELPLESADGLIKGRIDAIVPTPNGPVLQDYKSGAIFEIVGPDQLVLKDEYADQLKIYAALYHEGTGIWPHRPSEVQFTPAECEELAHSAKVRVAEVNEVIRELNGERIDAVLGNPSPGTCCYCPYRPACGPYRVATQPATGGWPADAWGEFRELRTLGNGRRLLALSTAGPEIAIRGLSSDPERHPALSVLEQGDSVGAYSLRRAGPGSFVEAPLTVIFKEA
jgi:hypothetical protein